MVNSNKELVTQQTKPYVKEAFYAFLVDLIIILLLWIIFFIAIYEEKKDIIIIFITSILYFLFAYSLHYKTAILLFIDKNKMTFVKKEVAILDFKIENSWSGWLGHSNISKFFPKEQMVDRYRIFYLNEKNEKNFVRCIMSLKKRKLIYRLFLESKDSPKIEICYLQRSKVLVNFNVLLSNNKERSVEKVITQLNHTI